MTAIRSQNLSTFAQNILRLEDLRPVLRALHARGIEPIALKGLALLSTVYTGDPGERTMSDLDLLIEPAQLQAAEEILLALGYTRVPQHQHTFRGGRGDTRIDLTAEIWYLDPEELAAFAGRAIPIEHGRLELRIPSLEDHFLFIATHAVVMHGQMRPVWAEDLRRIAALGPDWRTISKRARSVGLEIPLSLAIERVFGEEGVAGDDLLGPPRRRGLDRVRVALLEQALDRPETHETGHLLRFLFRGGPIGKARAVFRHLFPGLEFVKRRYGVRSTPGAIARSAWRPVSALVRACQYAWRAIAAPRHGKRVTS